jgi:group I intron endonuclease
MKICGVYKIQSIIKPKCIYIGSTKNINKRWKNHAYLLRVGRHSNSKLQQHYNKYGSDDLKYSLLCECGEDDRCAMEQFFIDALDPWFNISTKTIGIGFTDETRQKMSQSAKGRVPWNKGKTGCYSKEILEIMKNARIDYFKTDKGKELSLKIAESNRTRIESIETRQKKSNSHKGLKHSQESIDKIVKYHKGKKRTGDALKNIQEGIKKRDLKKKSEKLFIQDN